MKFLVTSILFFFYSSSVTAQAGTWTWMKGDTSNQNQSPNEPRSLYACAHWTDTTGKFWIYATNLWEFDPLLNTWIAKIGLLTDTLSIQAPKGIFDPRNRPGVLYNGVFTWTTPDNDLWMYGGNTAMLWRYSITLNQWAWMGTYSLLNYGTKGIADSINMPGYRQESNSAWVDGSGNLWFFGGGNESNDMWKYDITTRLWTWMSGSKIANNAGQYGNLGIASVNNYPSARWTNFFWKDDVGNFWVGLGHNYLATDIWKFNPVTLEWTWVSGSPNANCAPVGKLCDTSSSNQAGSRYENRSTWKISDALILTYGGQSCNGYINDLWAFLPIQNKWIKLGDYPMTGHYGTKGVASSLNYPKWRMGSASFKDRDNNCWAFSGWTNANDLWKYEIDWSCFSSIISGIDNLGEDDVVSVWWAVNGWQLTVGENFIGGEAEIFDANGRLVFQSAIQNPQSEISPAVAKGIYLLRISSAKSSVVRKLVRL